MTIENKQTVLSGYDYTAEQLRDHLASEKPNGVTIAAVESSVQEDEIDAGLRAAMDRAGEPEPDSAKHEKPGAVISAQISLDEIKELVSVDRFQGQLEGYLDGYQSKLDQVDEVIATAQARKAEIQTNIKMCNAALEASKPIHRKAQKGAKKVVEKPSDGDGK